MSKTVRGLNVRDVASDMKFEDDIRKKAALSKTPTVEKPYSRELNEMGRKAYFEEYYNDVKLENQIFLPIGPFTDPRETFSFKKGYQRGSEMVATVEKLNNINLLPDEYKLAAQNKHTR